MVRTVVATTWLALQVSGFRAGSQQGLLRGGETDDTQYTLVQYRGLGCNADKYVCQHLTKGACTTTTAQDGGVSFQVHAQLDENSDGSFTLKACEKSGCDCGYTQEYMANTCKGGTWGGSSLSFQLLPGEVEGCVTYDFDVAGGRHHDAYESAMANKTTFTADAEDADAKLLQHTVKNNKTEKAPIMDVGGPVAAAPEKPVVKREPAPLPAAAAAVGSNVAAFFHNWAGQTPPAPEQGFEGELVEHADQETTTKDWGREYGPNQYPGSHAALLSAFALVLVSA
jgi:hypothetical protein